MSKFIDLEPQVSDYYGTTPGQERRAGICDALRYLDSHPEHVPGRTMAESRYAAEGKGRSLTYMRGFDAALIELGATVIPDPEPTNLESISKLLAEFAELNASCGGEQGDHDLAEFLNARGVKDGGDDE